MQRILNLLLAVVLTMCQLSPALAADVKISQLPSAVSATSSDEFAVNQAGVTKKVTLLKIDNALGVSTHTGNATIHRSIDDASTTTSNLWSASKINTELGLKANASHAHSAADITSGTLTVSRGGTGLSSIAASKILYTSALDTVAPLSYDSTLAISAGTIGVQNNTSTQRVIVSKAGTTIGTRRQINLIEGSGVTLTTTDNAGSDRVDVTVSSSGASYPYGYLNTGVPIWLSTTTFSVGHLTARAKDDSANISKTSSTTVNLATTGLNGMAQGTSNLSGTVTVGAGSATTTFSASQAGVLQVGDVVCTAGAQCRRLASGAGTAWTAESNWTSSETTVTVKRGGRAPSTHYYLYLISDGATPGLILSTRNVTGGDTLVDLPSGYSTATARQLPLSIRLDSTSAMLKFLMTQWSGLMGELSYDVQYTNSGTTGTTNIRNTAIGSSFTNLSAASFASKIAKKCTLRGSQQTSGSAWAVRPTGASYNTPLTGADEQPHYVDVLLDSSQTFDAQGSGANINRIDVAKVQMEVGI